MRDFGDDASSDTTSHKIVTVNVDPTPSSESTVIVPFIFSASLSDSTKPSPVPPVSPDCCTWEKELKRRSICSRLKPIPVSRTLYTSCHRSVGAEFDAKRCWAEADTAISTSRPIGDRGWG